MTAADTPSRAAIWRAVVAERRSLAADLSGASPEQWTAPTACASWNVHDVVAHIVDTARATRLGFARDMVAARFDFDRANERGVARARGVSPEATLASLRQVADRRTGPPAPLPTRLVEAYVHGEDIRRAIGRTGADGYPTEMVAEALRHQVKTSRSYGGGRELVAGLRLVADDTDLVLGDGAEVRGSAIALLLAVSGRPVGDHELAGPGAPTLRARRAPGDQWATDDGSSR